MNFIKLHKKIFIIILIILILLIVFLGYILYKSSKVQIIPEDNFYVEVDEEDISKTAISWVKQYVGQYMQKYVKYSKKVDNINIENAKVLEAENKIVEVDFSVTTTKKNNEFFVKENWGNYSDKKKLDCQWVLTLSYQENSNLGKEICFVSNRITPAAYQAGKYNLSGKADQDKEKLQYESKKYYEDKEKECTYKIENAEIYVTYDNSNSWKKVETGDMDFIDPNKRYKLPDNLYTISKDVTAIINADNNIIYSKDEGNTWEQKQYKGKGNPYYLQFVNDKEGYLVEIIDAALAGERFIEILKTEDGGESWNKISNGPGENGSIRDGAEFKMLDENLGFVVDISAGGESSTLYITQDGMRTFTKVDLPNGTFKGKLDNSSLQWSSVYDTPEMPYRGNDGELILVVGQGADGDYSGGIKAAYKSNDNGLTWEFVEEFEPAPKEWEG